MRKEKEKKNLAESAYKIAVDNANSVCYYFFHQPKMPDKVKKLRKF